jgi:hypothetical protein
VVVGIGASVSQGMVSNNPFEDKNLFKRGLGMPASWIFYDTSIQIYLQTYRHINKDSITQIQREIK